jgi:flagellar motor switch protein FliM
LADILSQDEVDLLLSAVSEGEIAEELESRSELSTPHLTAYDFRRPDRVSKEQLKGLQSLFEAFAREVSVILPPYLRSVVRVDLTSIDQLTYDEFILSVARPTCLSILDMSPLEGNSVLELSPSVVFPIVDRILGGKGKALGEPRELTEIENRIVHRIVAMMLDCWKRSWQNLIEYNLKVSAMESDPLIVQIVAGSEMVILIGYELHIGETVGSMNMCIPLLVINPVLDQISQQAHYQRRMTADQAAHMHALIARTLRKAKVPVDAVLGHAELPLRELARLQIGDVIQLDSDVREPVRVEVGGLARFLAQPGRRGEQSAVQLHALVVDD